MKLGQIIKIFRIANRLKTKEVAERINKSSTFITEVESSVKKPSLNSLNAISNCFNVPQSTLVRIWEMSEKDNWNYQKTLYEVLKLYVEE